MSWIMEEAKLHQEKNAKYSRGLHSYAEVVFQLNETKA